MRAIPLLILLLASCGWVENEREERAEAARQETVAEIGRILTQTTRRVDRVARSTDRILSPVPVMTHSEEEALRLHLGDSHVRRARALGVRAADDAGVDSLVDDGPRGATRGEIVGRVLRDAVRLSAPGMVVGALLAAGAATAMRSMLLGLSPLDPFTFLTAAGLLLVVVLLAGLPPALRASGIQPVRALRLE